MATRQYIGARYVPKFYQNSVDGSTQWQANVVYEPLTWVTLQNSHMYISKKQVPATVGTPAENVDYWLDIGSYNGIISELQTEINNMKQYIGGAVNAVEAGVVPTLSDATTMTENARIINSLLQNGKVVYFPNGHYFVNDTLLINKKSGIIGESMGGTVIHSNTAGNGILVDIDVLGAHSEIIDHAYYLFILQNFSLFCAAYPNNTAAGIRFRNYTYEVTANFDSNTYRSLKGDDYAAEFRNSMCDHIYISGFKNGIESGYYLAYGLFTNMFIETCTEYGIYNKFSDSIYDNITITYCYNGLFEMCEENKFSNIGVKMCGYRHEYDASHAITSSVGVTVNNSKRDMFSNLEIQECYANGMIINNGSYLIEIANAVLDNNGFNSASSGVTDIGLQILNGSHDIVGTIVADNKNATPTQRLGLYVADNCYNNQLLYTERNQISAVRTIHDARRTVAALSGTFRDDVISLGVNNRMPNFTPQPRAIACYDGHNLTLDIHGYYDGVSKSPSDVIANWTDIFGSEVPSSGMSYLSGWTECIIYNTTDGTTIKAHILDAKTLVTDEAIPANKQISLTITVPVWLNYA